MSPVPHSVKFSWFLSEFIVLKVETEDLNLVSALYITLHYITLHFVISYANYTYSDQWCINKVIQVLRM